MTFDATALIGAFATVYGVAGALSVLLQARQMLATGRSSDVSARFLGTNLGGYAIWLVHGLSLGSVPIVVVHALGFVCGSVTLTIALKLRGPLLRPWRAAACD